MSRGGRMPPPPPIAAAPMTIGKLLDLMSDVDFPLHLVSGVDVARVVSKEEAAFVTWHFRVRPLARQEEMINAAWTVNLEDPYLADSFMRYARHAICAVKDTLLVDGMLPGTK